MPASNRGSAQLLRFTIVSTQRGWNGGENQASLLAHGLREQGHDCRILARAGGEFARRMGQAGLDTESFPGRGLSLRGLHAIRGHLRRTQPDVLFFNDSHALTSAAVAGLGLQHPVRIAARRVDYPLRSPWQYRWFADRIVCISRSVHRECLAGGLSPQQLKLIHSGVDPRRIASGDRQRGRDALQLDDGQPLLLCVGSLLECKGQFYLLESMASVVRRHPRVCLALAGDGKLRDALVSFAKQLGISNNVRFLGYRRDIADLMLACDLFVLPSVSEGLGTSVIDAMLAQRPIVTTTSGGIPELVGDLSDGPPTAWLVAPRDCQALAAAINEAFDAPAKGRDLAMRSRQRALAMFSAERMVEETLALCRETLAIRSGTAQVRSATAETNGLKRAA